MISDVAMDAVEAKPNVSSPTEQDGETEPTTVAAGAVVSFGGGNDDDDDVPRSMMPLLC